MWIFMEISSEMFLICSKELCCLQQQQNTFRESRILAVVYILPLRCTFHESPAMPPMRLQTQLNSTSVPFSKSFPTIKNTILTICKYESTSKRSQMLLGASCWCWSSSCHHYSTCSCCSRCLHCHRICRYLPFRYSLCKFTKWYFVMDEILTVLCYYCRPEMNGQRHGVQEYSQCIALASHSLFPIFLTFSWYFFFFFFF